MINVRWDENTLYHIMPHNGVVGCRRFHAAVRVSSYPEDYGGTSKTPWESHHKRAHVFSGAEIRTGNSNTMNSYTSAHVLEVCRH